MVREWKLMQSRRNGSKIISSIIAWLGIALIVLGAFMWLFGYLLAAPPYTSEGNPLMNFGFIFTPLLDIPGLIFILIGGFISKPKYFWLACIITAILHLGITFTSIIESILPFLNTVNFKRELYLALVNGFFYMSIVPFVIIFLEGIILKHISKNKPSIKTTFQRLFAGLGIAILFLVTFSWITLSLAVPDPFAIDSGYPKPTPSKIPGTSIQKYVKILYPQNGDILYPGDTIKIFWTSDFSELTPFRILLQYGGGQDLRDYEVGTTTNTGTFLWTITDKVTGKVQLKIVRSGGENLGYSENIVYFIIASK